MTRPFVLFLAALSTASAVDLSPLAPAPVQEGGRRKAYAAFAEEALLALSGRAALDIDGRKLSAMEVITNLWLTPAGWDQKPLILVNHKALKEALGLDPATRRFSYSQLTDNAELRSLIARASAQKAQPGGAKLTGLPKEAGTVAMRMAEFENMVSGGAFRFIPNPKSANSQWESLPATSPLVAPLSAAFASGNEPAFRAATETLVAELAKNHPEFQPPAWKLELEALYVKVHPFYWAWIFYAAAGIVLALTRFNAPGYVAAWVLAGSGFLLQIAGFASRILISGRAPVTNMYETVIWLAFGVILFALIFEAIYRCRYFLMGAVPVAVVSLILADTQTVALDRTIQPLVPVLRDNFWLSTHVTSITLSYAAFALSLGVAHIALGQVIAGMRPKPALYNYLYRALQVGVLLLTIGTILGAVWANYSWGRFWDWDPKEVWALVTLLAYLIVLHGRIAGKWGGFGMAVGAVLAFQCVLMAWYGVNFVLGVGLHSYGFGSGGIQYAALFAVLETGVVTIAVLRNRRCQSGRPGAGKIEGATAAAS